MKFYSQILLLFFVMNPIGNIPVFLSSLKHVNAKRHAKIIIREVAIAMGILIVFMFFGQYLLNAMQISPQALGISGGIILFLISIRLIFPPESEKIEKPAREEPFIVPLAIPLTAGPGAMATVMLFTSQNTGHIFLSLMVPVITCVLACCVLLSAPFLSSILKDRGLVALERLSGMLLTAMAIQMFMSGLENYFRLH